MSNLAFIETVNVTKTFEDDSKARLEVKVWDNYAEGSADCSADGLVDIEDELSILQFCKDYASEDSKAVCDVIDSLYEYEKGVNINGTFYSWDEIKHIFKDEENE